MDIFLVRHGEASASWEESSDPGLSEPGVEQAEAAARTLLDHGLEDALLLSSPLARARETAAPLARLLGKTVALHDEFAEVPAPVPLAQRKAWLRQFMQQQWHEQPANLCQWRSAALARLLELRQPAVVFSHFLLINAVVGQLVDHPDVLYFWPDNGSITHLRHTGDGLELVGLGRQMPTVVN